MLPTFTCAGRNRHIVDALGDRFSAPSRTHSAGGIDEQARETAERAGRATATPAVAPEAGWPAWPAVARQAGRFAARAQADDLAHAAGTKPLSSTFGSRRPLSLDGAPILFSARVEGRQAAGLPVDLLPHPPGQRFEWLDFDAAALVTPGSGHGAIHQEGGFRVRGLRVENERAKALGKDLRPPSVHEQGRIPRR